MPLEQLSGRVAFEAANALGAYYVKVDLLSETPAAFIWQFFHDGLAD
jgi:hypothetical protein